ncbi:MAG: alkaline phosphatase family protein [Solirubrobacterales bacterium]
MAAPSTPPERPEAPAVASCAACGAGMAGDQCYCVECGARRGPLPPFVAEAIGVATRHTQDPWAAWPSEHDALASKVPGEASEESPEREVLPMPTPRAAAVAVMALLAFGVLIGSAISPVAPSGAEAPTLLALVRPAATTAEPPTTSESPTPPPAAPVEAATPAPAPTQTTITETVSQSSTKTLRPAAGNGKREGPAQPAPGAGELPPVKHVFLLVLSDQGYPAAFGPSSTAPYLAKTLPHEGELLENYYAVASGELANGVALIGGQGPTPQTAADCPLYTDLAPGTSGAEGQALGSGCVYPRQTLTLADQLSDEGRTWRAYVEGIEAGAPAQPASCRHPTLGAADPNNTPTPGDAYVTWRNPFVYFHSLIDTPACAQNDVGLPRLAADLKAARSTPTLAYIVPDRCHDGSEAPCAPGAPAGLAAAETFLRTVVPEIEASPAYKEGGLIAITFDQAPQSGLGADSSGCCTTTPYPNMPASSTTTMTTTATTVTSTATTAPPTTTTPSTIAPAPSTTAPTSAMSTPGAPGTQTGSPAGGGRVGLLLISKYVKPGTLNVSGEYNHFALLRSIENLFGLQPLGYAGPTGLLTFDSSVFNAKP